MTLNPDMFCGFAIGVLCGAGAWAWIVVAAFKVTGKVDDAEKETPR